MKHNTLKSLLGIVLLAVIPGITGCTKDEGGSTPGRNQPKEVFNFSTRATYTLSLNYDVPSGYSVYFEVYAENPYTTDENGRQIKRTDLHPVDKGFTDEKGAYSKPIVLNSAVETLYIYTPNAGVPKLLTSKVENGTLSAPALYKSAAGTSQANKANHTGTRAINSLNRTNFPNIPTLTLGTWRHSDAMVTFPQGLPELWGNNKARVWGRPDYMYAANKAIFPADGTKEAITISADIYKTISTVLPGDNNGTVDPEVLKSGDIHVTKDAEVDLYFVEQGGMYTNTLAYYCYPTGQAPSDPSQIKAQVVAFPSATHIKSQGRYLWNQFDYGALLPGEGVRLHYIDQNGIDQGTIFPKGTSIGWILYSDGYKNTLLVESGNMIETGIPYVGLGAIYSNPKLQNDIPEMAVFRHGDFVVMAFEDTKLGSASEPCDYDDVIFHAAATPADAITEEIPNKDPNAPTNATITYRGILSFEDNWPYRGDFDMNDVVIQYKSEVVINSKNEIIETTDYYTPLWSGAAYNNSFAVENKNVDDTATISFESGDGTAVVEDNILRAASFLLDYANQGTKKTLKISVKFATPIAKEDFIYPPYNPFITVKGNRAHEVHLTNMAPTSFVDTSLLGMGHDFSKPERGLYYITYDESGKQMPFAIDIMFSSDEDMAKYVIPAETQPINLYYPGFLKWLNSNGTTNKDWYLHPIK